MNEQQKTKIHAGQSGTVRAAIIGMGNWGLNLVNNVQGKSDVIRFVAGATRTPAKRRGIQPQARHPHSAELRGRAGRSRRSMRWCWRRRTPCTPSRSSPPRARASTCSPRSRSASRSSDSAAAVAACAEHKVTLAVGYNWRFQPALQEIARMLADGRLGKLLHIEGNFCGPSVYRFGRDHWRQDRDEGARRRHDRARRARGRCDALSRGRDRHRSTRRASGWRRISASTTPPRCCSASRAAPPAIWARSLLSAETWRMQVFGSKGWAEVGDVEHLTTWQMKVCYLDPANIFVKQKPQVMTFDTVSTERAELEHFARAIQAGQRAGGARRRRGAQRRGARCHRRIRTQRRAGLHSNLKKENMTMRLSRRSLGFVTAALLLACAALSAQAQTTGLSQQADPDRRAVAAGRAARPDRPHRREQAADALGQTVIVENRAGAGGMVGTGYVAKLPADGYTILITTASHTAIPAFTPNTPYDAVKDFTHVTLLAAELRPGARRAARAAGEDRAGAGGAGAQAAGQAQLRPGRARNGEPHPGGGDGRRRRHRHVAGALQGHADRHDRPAGRPHRHVLHRHPDRAAAGAGGQAPRARGDRQGALEGHARRADHAGAGLSRTTTSSTGSAPGCRPARRRRSWRGCTPRSGGF